MAPFEVRCPCGQSVAGQRTAHHQVVPCPGCGRDLFVFPRTWFRRDHQSPAAPVRLGRWLLLTLAASGALMVAFALAARSYLPRPTPSPSPTSEPARDLRSSLAAARQELQRGQFRLALAELDSVHRQTGQGPSTLSPRDRAQLAQLHNQADLLARLLHESLEQVLEHGQRVRAEKEWEAQLADYRDRTIVFDDVVRRHRGVPVLCYYEVHAGMETARIALEDLKLFDQLPLDVPHRMLFGASLASFRRETAGQWVLRFQPDSGVLLTDPAAAAGCCPPPLDDAMRDVLARQRRWLNLEDDAQ